MDGGGWGCWGLVDGGGLRVLGVGGWWWFEGVGDRWMEVV